MTGHYWKSTWRQLAKTKLFTALTLAGLGIGMAACLLILHYVQFEQGYDRFHPGGHRIFRLRYERTSDSGETVKFASCTPPAAPAIGARFPEVEKIARIFRYPGAISYGEKTFTEERLYFAEPAFFEILRFQFLHGDPSQDLNQPGRAFISQSTARKYFGDADPLGKMLSLDKKADYHVAGIFADIPPGSHLKFDLVLSFQNLRSLLGEDVLSSWGHTGFYTYLRLRPDTGPALFEKQLGQLVDSAAGELQKVYQVRIRLKLQPLRDIHLTSHFMQEFELNGNRESVHLLLLAAVFIMLMAWVNYINLSTARALTRAREAGLRKILGAGKGQLITQFFHEVLVINLAAMTLAVLLVWLTLPFFAGITGTPLETPLWTAGWFWLALPVMLLAGLLFSGLYPVLLLSSFEPLAVVRGRLLQRPGGAALRKVLVFSQYFLALLLTCGSLAIYRQLIFLQQLDPGFNLGQVLVIRAPRVRPAQYASLLPAFKEEARKQAGIRQLCYVSEVPGRQILWDNGGIRRAGDSAGKGRNYQIVGADYEFPEVFGLQLAAGRYFSREFPADRQGLLLNETAVSWMGFGSPREAIGRQVDYWGNIYTILGVLRDYHQQSPKAAFEPHLFRLLPEGRDARGYFAVKLDRQLTGRTLPHLEAAFRRFFPGNPYEYFFLDEYFGQQYQEDVRFGQVFALFSLLALLVTALGIFGLTSFIVLQRTREMGIRKVLGAGSINLLGLLTAELLWLPGLSMLTACPVAYLGIQNWLEGFASRFRVDGWQFLLPILLVAAVTLATVGWQVVRAVLVNPAETLRQE